MVDYFLMLVYRVFTVTEYIVYLRHNNFYQFKYDGYVQKNFMYCITFCSTT